MNLRTLRDVLVLAVLAMLPLVIAGCATARAAGNEPDGVVVHRKASTSGRPMTGGGAEIPGPSGMSFLVPPQSMPAPQEELWVIQKAPAAAVADDGETPGTGAVVVPRGDALVPIPLKHTDVKASVVGHIGTVDVTQQFHNPFDSKIEAVYVFPLPHNAAVSEFVMTVGERRIRGIIREREEAKQIYEQAKSQGYVASLLEQERPNVFTQKVANIEPGKRIDVSVRYFHTLGYTDGWYEWAFPMVVGPRFNPPAFGSEAQARGGTTDGIGAAARGSRGASGQKTEVQYFKPGERSGHDVSLAVTLDALVPVEAVESRTHRVTVSRTSPRAAEVVLSAADSIPNRDFVLRWKVAGEGVKSGLVVRRGKDGGDGYFALTVVPPAELRGLPRSPVEMVFTLDVSGSMSGKPIEQAKAAVRYALRHMRPDDSFQIVKFAGGTERMSDKPLAASPANVRRAMQYLEGASAGGGTMMLEGLREALQAPADGSRPRYVVFLTDGYIGNEAEILGALQRMLGGSRVFAMGVGPATNRYLLEHMAKLGRGAVAYLGPDENAEQVMAEYFGAISHPALTDLALDLGGVGATELYPQRIPDLFVGRPVTVVGRFKGEAPKAVKVSGKVRGEVQVIEVAMSEDAPVPSPDGAEQAGDRRSGPLQRSNPDAALPAVWARMKIAELGDHLAREPGDGEVAVRVRQVALEYGLMSAYTSFVAVDSMTRTAGEYGTTVVTPVPVPEGLRYETSVPK
jgi:Ca-activated chloride channel family protein